MRFHELFYHLRDIHTVISRFDKQTIKNNFDNNFVVIDDPIDLFALKNKLYIQNRRQDSINRRLFITTGGMSLLTAISIRKEMNARNCEDYLIIETQTKHNSSFLECNTNIASLYDFKKIIFLQGQLNFNILINYGLEEIDEIFMVAHVKLYNYIIKLYPNTKYTFFEEAPGATSYPIYDYSKIKKVIVHNYIGKFNYLVWHNIKVKPNIEFIDEIFFNKILQEVRTKLNITLNIDKTEKYILLCGPDIDSKKYIKTKNVSVITNKLIKNGYKILFKKHPRDTDTYSFGNDIIAINTSYPIELYDLPVAAIVNFSSSLCITMPHFNKIAVFSDMIDIKQKKLDIPFMQNLNKYILKQYTIPIKVLLDFDHSNYNPSELKDKFMELFNKHILDIPDVSENKVIAKFIAKHSYIQSANFKLFMFP
jgi:hypothetical protein